MGAHGGMFLHTSLLPPPITLKFTLAGERESERGKGGGGFPRLLRGLQRSLRVLPCFDCSCPTTEVASVFVQSCGGGDHWAPGTGHVESGRQALTLS